MKQKKTVTHEQFVTLWQKAKTFQDAVAAIGDKSTNVSVRASFLRKNGVPLKRFAPAGKRMEARMIARLAALAKSLARGE